MKCESLYQEFKKFEGQPVMIYTDDGRVLCGIDLVAYEDAVRIIDKCSRTVYVAYEHIDSVVEPQMELDRGCKSECGCKHDND